MNNINPNSHCVNANIKAHILSDDQMETAGFRYIKSYNKNNLGEWVYIHRLDIPNSYNIELTFDVHIPVDGSDINIQVIDEDFCQPYDYQYMLENNPNFTLALLVRECVEEQMQKLQDAGILSGHNKYDYI